MATFEHSATKKRERNIQDLPTDILCKIFSEMWRKDAKGIPSTCKRFKSALESNRFRGFPKLHVKICEVPPSITHLMKQMIDAGEIEQHRPIGEAVVPYDHLDSLRFILDKLQHDKSTWVHPFPPDSIKSLYGYARNRIILLNPEDYAYDTLVRLAKHSKTDFNDVMLITSDYTWEELATRHNHHCVLAEVLMNEGDPGEQDEDSDLRMRICEKCFLDYDSVDKQDDLSSSGSD